MKGRELCLQPLSAHLQAPLHGFPERKDTQHIPGFCLGTVVTGLSQTDPLGPTQKVGGPSHTHPFTHEEAEASGGPWDVRAGRLEHTLMGQGARRPRNREAVSPLSQTCVSCI